MVYVGYKLAMGRSMFQLIDINEENILKIFKKFLACTFSFLICNVVLVLGVQQSDSVIHTRTHILFFKLFSIIGYYKILSEVP